MNSDCDKLLVLLYKVTTIYARFILGADEILHCCKVCLLFKYYSFTVSHFLEKWHQLDSASRFWVNLVSCEFSLNFPDDWVFALYAGLQNEMPNVPLLASKCDHVMPKHSLTGCQMWHDWSSNIFNLV